MDENPVRLWIPLALVGMIAVVYVFLYLLSGAESSGSPFGLANSVGFVAVAAGILAAIVLFRRATPLR